jgi:hypothetical protein
MRKRNTPYALSVAAASISIFTLLGVAAEAQTGTGVRTNPERNAAIERCMNKALADTPRRGPSGGGQHRRSNVYADCMRRAGFNP